MSARRPIASIGQVAGLATALGEKLSLAGGILTGQVLSTQALGTALPRFHVENYANVTSYGQGAYYVRNRAAGLGIEVRNDGGGYGLAVRNLGTGRGIDVYNSSSGRGVSIVNHTSALNAAISIFNNATDSAGRGLYIEDTAAGTSDLARVVHSGSGYAWDVSNNAGAGSAFVIHQYSQVALRPAFWIDNCGDQPAIQVLNTDNQTAAPGQLGTGHFLYFRARPAIGGANVDVYYVDGQGVPCMVPRAAAPSVLADGKMWVEGTGANMHAYIRLNGVTKELAVVS